MKTEEIIKRIRNVRLTLMKNGCTRKQAEDFINQRAKIHTLKLKALEREAKNRRC